MTQGDELPPPFLIVEQGGGRKSEETSFRDGAPEALFSFNWALLMMSGRLFICWAAAWSTISSFSSCSFFKKTFWEEIMSQTSLNFGQTFLTDRGAIWRLKIWISITYEPRNTFQIMLIFHFSAVFFKAHFQAASLAEIPLLVRVAVGPFSPDWWGSNRDEEGGSKRAHSGDTKKGSDGREWEQELGERREEADRQLIGRIQLRANWILYNLSLLLFLALLPTCRRDVRTSGVRFSR